MIRVVLCISLCFLIACREAPRKAVPPKKPTAKSLAFHFQDSAYSSIELRPDTVNGFTEVEQIATTQAYHYVEFKQYYTGGMLMEEALISERTTRLSRDAPYLYGDGTVRLETRLADGFLKFGGNFDSVAWRRTVPAYEVQYRPEYIDVIQGSPLDRRVHRLLDYHSGRTLIQHSSELYCVQRMDNNDWRYIGYLTIPDGPDLDNLEAFSGEAAGALTYASPLTGAKQCLVLFAREPESDLFRMLYWDSLTLEGVHAKPQSQGWVRNAAPGEHWQYADLNHFNIVLHFAGAGRRSLRIPVRNDRLDTAGLRSDLFTFQLLRAD